MEKQKNNAVEKVENIEKETTNEKNGQSRERKAGAKRKSVSSAKKRSKNVAAAKRKNKEEKARAAAEKRAENKRRKQAEKAERERAAAEKRVEIARIKAHRKAEKEKAKAAALREKNRKKAEAKEKRQIRLEERLARREALKHETKKQREKRIAAEKAQKAEMRREEKQRKAELKKQKFLAKKQRKEQRTKSREKNKGFGGWLAAVISLGVSTLVLASVLTFTFLMPTASDNMLESSYRRSFYDAVEQIDNIDLNMSKILASNDGAAVQKYLLDLAVNSELAENDLQSLPLKDENKFYTVKLVNQIGDYAKYLNKKLIDGENLSLEEKENLKKLYKANATLKESLAKTVDGMGNDFSFASMIAGDKSNVVLENFSELENLSVEYPELIYDGPFSDGADDREIKGLSGDKITEEQALGIFKDAFGEYGLTSVVSAGTLEGSLRCFNVTAESDGEVLFAQISETGGKIISFAYSGSCRRTDIDGDDATEKALEFLAKRGLADVKPVWINLSNNVYTINFAATEGDIILYPDLIKVRVCAETGMTIGMEATSYYTNHTERRISNPAITAEQAREKVSDGIEIITCRVAITPVGENGERLCYEFTGNMDGSVYYVYIDAETGRQVEMFKVISSTEGEMLM